MKDFYISYAPTQQQLDQIKEWLLEERNSTSEGFYCNWNVIRKAFEQKRIAIISVNHEATGFTVWEQRNKSATLVIMEIKPSFRVKGLGRKLTDALFSRFISDSIVVVDLQCAPSESEAVWRKLGFTSFPKGLPRHRSDDTEPWLYKILIPSIPPCNVSIDETAILLWNDEPYRVKQAEPTWSWKIKLNKEKIVTPKPIIHPCSPEWQLSWRINGQYHGIAKAKYFNNGKSLYNEYLVIL